MPPHGGVLDTPLNIDILFFRSFLKVFFIVFFSFYFDEKYNFKQLTLLFSLSSNFLWKPQETKGRWKKELYVAVEPHVWDTWARWKIDFNLNLLLLKVHKTHKVYSTLIWNQYFSKRLQCTAFMTTVQAKGSNWAICTRSNIAPPNNH